MPAFSDPEEVRVACLKIFDGANKKSAINGLKQSSFSYGLPFEGGLANICGYLYGSAKIDDSLVERWIIDDRIRGEIEWTPVFPGKHGDWKQLPPITSILAACCTRSLHDWVGTSSDAVKRGGCPRKTPAPADGWDSCAAADAGAAAATARRHRVRPPRPQPVATDSAVQAAVRARLHNMLANSVSDICRTVFPDDRSWVGQPKKVQVELLMANHVLRTDVLGITSEAPDTQPEPEDTPDLEALRARLKQLPKATLEALCPAVFPSPDHSWRGLERTAGEASDDKTTELMLALAVRETTAGAGSVATLPVEIVLHHLDPDHAGVSSGQPGGAEVHHHDLEVEVRYSVAACVLCGPICGPVHRLGHFRRACCLRFFERLEVDPHQQCHTS